MSDSIADFIDYLHKNGLAPAMPREIQADDRIRRFTIVSDHKGSKNGVYRLAINGDMAFGWVRSHKESRTLKYFSGSKEQMSAEQRAILKQHYEERKAANAQERLDIQKDAAILARRLWERGIDGLDVAGHKYATRKKVDLGGTKISREVETSGMIYPAGEILVPLYGIEDGKLWNVQRINARGEKKFLPGARLTGLYHPIGKGVCLKAKPYIFCEGWATGKTLWRALECPVLCAMNAGNLLPVARAFRRKHIYARFLFAADNDQWTMDGVKQKKLGLTGDDLKAMPGDDPRWTQWRAQGLLMNPGMDKATEAARLANGLVVAPPFLTVAPGKPTDWNDFCAKAAIQALFKSFIEF